MAEDLDENKRFKYPYLASEILSCEIFSICEAILSNIDLLKNFWTLLDRPAPLNPLTASYFTKVNSVLLQKKMPEMITFIRAQPDVVQKLLAHIGSSAIADLLLKLISMEEVPEGTGVVEWLSKEGLVSTLVSRLDPILETETHNTAAQTLLDVIAVSYSAIGPQESLMPTGLGASIMGEQGGMFSPNSGGNALVDELKSEIIMNKLVDYMLEKSAPHSGSTLTNGINIIIELIRRYCSEIEQAEYQQHQYQQLQQQQRQGPPPPSDEKLKALATDLNELLRVIGSRLLQFAELIHAPRHSDPVNTTIGKQHPLGSERLKTCELFAEILHLQYLYTSSPLFERLISAKKVTEDSRKTEDETREENADEKAKLSTDPNTGVADELVAITDKFIDAKILPVCLDLFFNFPWNNFLHSVVYDMIAKVFNTYSYTSTTIASKPPSPFKPEGDVETASRELETVSVPIQTNAIMSVEEQMQAVKDVVRKLVLSIFKDGELTKRITKAQRDNDFEVTQPRGVRLGYMGHLTYISDEVCKLLEKCSEDLSQEIGDLIGAEDWQEYVAGVLRETKERDRQPLGGVRPNAGPQQNHLPLVTGVGGAFAGGGMDDTDIGASIKGDTGKRDSDDEDDLDSIGTGTSDVYVGDGDVASDQFARYLCHQIVADLPDRFMGAESSDDEEDEANAEWIGEFESKDFDVREAFDPENPFPHKRSSLGEDFDPPRGDISSSISEAEESAGEADERDQQKDSFDTNEMLGALDTSALQTGWADFSQFKSGPGDTQQEGGGAE
ncbi:hypothetical protein SpCBS45565_g05457 [Spizellomyces sp. 'palustris']|nr:hypothetical protein SpCBS45565_g05457 [Spizellomyces sp. 'palustris']